MPKVDSRVDGWLIIRETVVKGFCFRADTAWFDRKAGVTRRSESLGLDLYSLVGIRNTDITRSASKNKRPTKS